ncbi:unnamed protein product [Clonostachys rosea]|uniref:Acetyl-coenzyme A synthetase n=1 Tax=Bionectria ochroleuca TaxID=29856 RepID=A0ABY6V2L4_BIOOC|nr:unnamed protein product [Clonostachys rosea]
MTRPALGNPAARAQSWHEKPMLSRFFRKMYKGEYFTWLSQLGAQKASSPVKSIQTPSGTTLNQQDCTDTPVSYARGKSDQLGRVSLTEYRIRYDPSITDAPAYWAHQARTVLSWVRGFETVCSGSFARGDIKWFVEGQLNASYNCVDRHAFQDPDRVAIIFEGNEENEGRNISYGELLEQVCKVAWVLKESGVRKGDIVAIYMPVTPEAIVAILACARIGAVHSVIFAGFSPAALRTRVVDAKCKAVITADESRRGSKTINLKNIVDAAVEDCPFLTTVIVHKRAADGTCKMKTGRDMWWHEECSKWPCYIPPEPLNAEDPLFLLYTSGSTGRPKGLMHTVGGYLVGAAVTTKHVFDVRDGDRFFCGGDIGWITGHTYLVYGPLLLGVSTLVFEGTLAYPTYERYWKIIEKHRVTQLHSSPTALRMIKKAGDKYVGGDLSSLRTIGCVGEPLAPEVWKWCHEVIGKGKIHIVDTYFQTETGSNVLTPLVGMIPPKPGSVTLPFFGIRPAILDPLTGEEIQESSREGVLAFKAPWPSMARTIYGYHSRFMETYMNPYKGYYFTGDAATRDEDGYYWIRGRVDDVINVSGHRLSTAEVEAALLKHPAVAETAVIGVQDDLTGQALNALVALKPGKDHAETLEAEFKAQVRKEIGPFATPKAVFIVDDLPKTRSGKIMRRILRNLVEGKTDQLGDTTTVSLATAFEPS